MLSNKGELLDPTDGIFETMEVAELVKVTCATLNSWRVRHKLFGGSRHDTTTRYLWSVLDACNANLMGCLTWHGLPASDAARITLGNTEAMLNLLHKEAPSILTFYRNDQGRIVAKIIPDRAATKSRARIVTRVDLRRIVDDVMEPYGIEISDE